MSQALCRLCLSSERLICTFDARLTNAQQLRMCILLCTGVEINVTDEVSKMVCHNCLRVAVKLFKYRETAVANDKALKELVGQNYIIPLCNRDDILKLHNSIIESVSHTKVAESVAKFYETVRNEADDITPPQQKYDEITTESENIVHETLADVESESQNLIPESAETPGEVESESQILIPEFAETPSEVESESQIVIRESQIDIPTELQVTDSEIGVGVPDDVVPESESTVETEEECIGELQLRLEEDEIDDVESSDTADIAASIQHSEVHSSIRQLFSSYPNIIVPNEVLVSDITPLLQVDKSEANKYLDQLQYYDEAVENENDSFNDRFPDVDVVRIFETQKDLEVEATDNTAMPVESENQTVTKIKLYRERSLSHENIYRTDRSNYYADPDYYGERAFKARKRKFGEVGDDSCSDCGNSDNSDAEANFQEPERRTTELIVTRSSKYKIPKLRYHTDSGSDSDLLGFPKAEERIRLCEYCNKVCYSRSQLRHHERTHRRCAVCHKMYRTDEALELHLQNVCYKTIEENQPFLQLLRIDDHPLIVKQYQPAFEYFFSRLNDETYEGYGKTDDGYIVPDKNFPLYHTEEHVKNESAYILDVFKKFQGIQNIPVTRNKIIQTRRSETIIKYSNQNQIILQEMYSDLLMYKVPIQMVVNQKISAHISYTTRPTLNKTIDSWSDKTPVDVVATPKLLNLLYSPPVLHFFSPKKPSVLKTVTNKPVPNVRTKTVPKSKGGNTKTVASVAGKVPPNPGGTKTVIKNPGNRQQFYNITKILTAVTTNSQGQTYTVPKTVMNVTQKSSLNTPIKQEGISDNLPNRIIVTQPNASSKPNSNTPRQNIVFKIPFNPAKQTTRNEPQMNGLIKEEPSILSETLTKQIIVTPSAPKGIIGNNSQHRPNLIFRFPYNANSQNQHPLYQALSSNSNSAGQNGNPNLYLPQGARVQQHKNQYIIPVTSFNLQQNLNAGQNGLQFRNLSNSVSLLKNGQILNSHSNINSPHSNVSLSSPSNVNQTPNNGSSFYSSRNSAPSPINSISSPINSVPSPINSAPSPIPSPVPAPPPPYSGNSFSSDINSISYSPESFTNSFSPSDTSAPYSSDPYPPLNSFPPSDNPISYGTDSFPSINSSTYTSSAFPSENPTPYPDPYSISSSYDTKPYPSSDSYSSNAFQSNSYSPNSFQSSDAYTPNSYSSTSYTPPQYIPPYNPLSEFGSFNDANSMHLLQPQHLSTSAVGGKVFLRVKQPWEINQV